MEPIQPTPVKLIIGALYGHAGLLECALEMTVADFGAIDYRSPEFEFVVTDYYEQEMGAPLYRQFFSYRRLLDPGELPAVKLRANDIETRLARTGKRRVNLDPGYMDYHKVVLASAKYNGQKVYLRDGIYADPTLAYSKGEFTPYPWAFPDFKSGQYDQIFLHIRALYKAQVKEA